MSEPETVTIHAARLDPDDDLWLELHKPGRWHIVRSGVKTRDELERDYGPTRPVRVCTVDPARDAAVDDLLAAARELARGVRRATAGPLSEEWRTLLADVDAAADRLAETGPETASLSPPAAEQATPAPQDTLGLSDAEKAAFLAADRELNGPAGLSAEQEIRARALEAAVRWFANDDTTTHPDDALGVAGQFADFIRDGGSDV